MDKPQLGEALAGGVILIVVSITVYLGLRLMSLMLPTTQELTGIHTVCNCFRPIFSPEVDAIVIGVVIVVLGWTVYTANRR